MPKNEDTNVTKDIKENKELVLFENSKIRRQMCNGEWYYSIVDIVSILTEQEDYQKSRKYWNKLKERIQKEENSEVVTNCHQLKLVARQNHLNYGLPDWQKKEYKKL